MGYLGTASKRTVDTVDLCYQALQCDAETAVLDTSQDISRKPWACGHIPTMTRSSSFYMFGRQRPALGVEHLRFLGFDDGLVDTSIITAHEAKDLAGDAMAPPAVCLVSMALLSAMAAFGLVD